MNISIAMCTYNGERYLEQQLQSIAAQTLQPFELVICDDGSTDDTPGIVERFRQAVPFPVTYQGNPVNLGSTKNFEQAIRMCTGEVIALCDQDDAWLPEKLATMADAFERNPAAAAIFSNAHLMDGEGDLLAEDLWHRAEFTQRHQRLFTRRSAPFHLVARDTVTGATLLFRSGFRPQILPISAEWVHDGWIALILSAISELQPLPACVMTYRLHTAQQIGAQERHWYHHLSTPKQKALASHRQLTQRFEAMAKRLDELADAGWPVDPDIARLLRRRSIYLQRRTRLLETSRGRRVLPALRLLPDYWRYQSGIISLLRDLFH